MNSIAMRAWVIAFLICSTVALVGCEKYALDRQMKELCEKDGGVVVFEVEKLPPEEFNKDGIPLYRYWLDPKLIGTSQRLGPGFRYVEHLETIKSGNPMSGQGRLTRFVEEIYRMRDGRLLGRSVTYDRSGGDFIVLDHFSTAGCPIPSPQLMLSVFRKEQQ